MRVLITGGAGYIGSHTVKELVKNNYYVVVFDNLSYGHRQAVDKKAKFIKSDLANQRLLEKILKREEIEAVIHFAGFIQVGESVKEPLKYFKNNFFNGLNLLEAMKNTNVKYIIYSSSAGVYGQPEKIPIKEDSTKDPVNTYGRTKLMFEWALQSYQEAYGLKFMALRYFNAAGASAEGEIGEDHQPETHIIPLLIQTALGQRPEFQIFGQDYATKDGTCIRDYIHVEDLALAHLLALEKLQREGKSAVYNLGLGRGFSNQELVKTVKKISGVDFKISYDPRRPGDPAELVADSSQAQKELNWTLQYVTIESIIETAWQWHKNHLRGFK